MACAKLSAHQSLQANTSRQRGGGGEVCVLRCTSGTPPTAVDTTMRPAAAASTIAMQKASVSDAFMKMSPWTCTMQIQVTHHALTHSFLPHSFNCLIVHSQTHAELISLLARVHLLLLPCVLLRHHERIELDNGNGGKCSTQAQSMYMSQSDIARFLVQHLICLQHDHAFYTCTLRSCLLIACL